jgi:hypothetical protein
MISSGSITPNFAESITYLTPISSRYLLDFLNRSPVYNSFARLASWLFDIEQAMSPIL